MLLCDFAFVARLTRRNINRGVNANQLEGQLPPMPASLTAMYVKDNNDAALNNRRV
jgi:hypothetical protein